MLNYKKNINNDLGLKCNKSTLHERCKLLLTYKKKVNNVEFPVSASVKNPFTGKQTFPKNFAIFGFIIETKPTDLEGELCAAKVCFLLLPEVVRFDDERHTDLDGEELLQRLQQGLDQFPLWPTHVDDHSETAFTYVLTEKDMKRVTGRNEKDHGER